MPLATVGGVKLYHEWHGAGPGAPLVLVTGLGGDSTAWGFQLAAFAPGRRCLVFDNRGVGRSDAPDVPFSTADMAADLLGLLDTLDVRRAHLLGVSMGGAIVQEAALADPDRIASLQLHCTWAGPDPYFRAVVEHFKTLRRRLEHEEFLRAVGPWVFTAACYAERPEFVELVVQRGLGHPHPQPLHGYLRQADAVLGHDTRARLGTLRCPTLVTVGTEDILTPPRLSREVAARIPEARLEVIPGAGHGYFWEMPRAFNAAGLTFLAVVEPS
ncbi:MAG TPA: alpha/beta fold hydrolase [Methylomirabilota bacterium]|jgi:pimeloyl-ACP methyl ester carboxylesterase|nr:alpha/beta fold hydrolase [Methylomirabilota bacterium]